MKKILRAFLWVLTAFILFFTPVVALKKTGTANDFPLKTEDYKRVLTLWNIDTFEGGIGSRGDFLSEVLLPLADEGTVVLVSAHTVNSAKENLSKGVIPDIVSFGVGADFLAPYVRELPFSVFVGGEISGKTYAVPWCRGGYFFISKTEDHQLIDRLIVSQGEYNRPIFALKEEGAEYNSVEFLSPLDAYTAYLSDESATLLGTQRDIWRLTRRGVSFYAFPAEKFSDLYQYVAVTTDDEENYSACVETVRRLAGIGAKALADIGMFGADANAYDGALGSYDTAKTTLTLSPFTSAEILKDADGVAVAAKEENYYEKIKNALKHL